MGGLLNEEAAHADDIGWNMGGFWNGFTTSTEQKLKMHVVVCIGLVVGWLQGLYVDGCIVQ